MVDIFDGVEWMIFIDSLSRAARRMCSSVLSTNKRKPSPPGNASHKDFLIGHVLQQVVAGLKVVGKFPHKINGSRRTVEKEMSE